MAATATSRAPLPIWARVVVIGFVATLMLAVGGTTAASVAVVQAGAMRVSVHEKRAGGDHVNLIFPAALVDAGLLLLPWVVPDDVWGDARDDLARVRPIVLAASRELERLPDGVLVEVRDHEEHVRIGVRGGTFSIDVDDAGETVHVSVPVSMLRCAAHALPSGS